MRRPGMYPSCNLRAQRRRDPRIGRAPTFVARMTLLLLVAWASTTTLAAAPAARPGTLVLEAVEVTGNTRTSDATAVRLLGLEPGRPITQDELLAAVARLRERRAFRELDYFTRPGATRGAVVLVLEVAERGPDLRLGTGQSDLDGWYLIPLELSLDNQLGRGEEAAARFKFGYRHAGFDLYYREGTAPRDRWRWEVAAEGRSNLHVYFVDDVEYVHAVDNSGLAFTLGRRLGAAWRLDLGLRVRDRRHRFDRRGLAGQRPGRGQRGRRGGVRRPAGGHRGRRRPARPRRHARRSDPRHASWQPRRLAGRGPVGTVAPAVDRTTAAATSDFRRGQCRPARLPAGARRRAGAAPGRRRRRSRTRRSTIVSISAACTRCAACRASR